MIYISGPMTGLPDFNRPAFNAMAAKLKAEGKKVFNPADIRLADNAKWADYMRECIVGLMACNTMIQLDGWENSKGSCIETSLAIALDFEFI